MSIALVHFLVGATIALALGYVFDRRDATGLLIYAGGIWGMIPDLSKFLPFLEPLHDNVLIASLFAFHGLLDVLDPTDDIAVGLIAVAIFGNMLLLYRIPKT